MNNLVFRNAMRLGLGFLLCSLLEVTVSAQEPHPNPQNPSGEPAAAQTNSPASQPKKVVLKVGNEQVTQAEFDTLIGVLSQQGRQVVTTQGLRPIGDQYATMLVLSQKAVNEHLDSSQEFLSQLALHRLQLLANTAYINLQHQSMPTSEEIGQYYSAHQTEFEEVQARRIFVRKKPEDAKEGTPGLSSQEAKTRAEALRKALAAGDDAKKVAQDFKSPEVIISAEPLGIRHGQFPAELDKALFGAKDRELTEPNETPQAVTFFQVIKHTHRELKDVKPVIERKLQQEKLNAALNDLKKRADIWMDEEYFKTAPPPAPPGLTPAPVPPKPSTTTPPASPPPSSPPAPAGKRPPNS